MNWTTVRLSLALLLLTSLATLGGCQLAPWAEGEGPADFVGSQGVVVGVFISRDCPIANRYASTLRRLHGRFADQLHAFLIVYVDPGLSTDEMYTHAKEYQLPAGATLFADSTLQIAEFSKIRVTPEAVVWEDGAVRYQGRIDDLYVDFGQRRTAPSRNDLEIAIEEVLAGEPVTVPRTDAVGCFISDLRNDLSP